MIQQFSILALMGRKKGDSPLNLVAQTITKSPNGAQQVLYLKPLKQDIVEKKRSSTTEDHFFLHSLLRLFINRSGLEKAGLIINQLILNKKLCCLK